MSATDFDPKMLEALICPLTHTELRLEGEELISKRAKLAFPIKEGIPVLLIEEARRLDD